MFAQFLFTFKFSYLDQFYNFTCTIHLYRFYHNVYPSHAQFLRFLFLVFLQKIFFCTVFIFCKFSYFNQFYIFQLAILLYHFYHNIHRSHVQTFKFFPLCSFIEKIFFAQFSLFFANSVI